MSPKPWQVEIFAKSLKKKEKLRLLEKYFSLRPSDFALDLGCAQGILSFFLRQKGGYWLSADEDFENLSSARELLQRNLIQLAAESLPFKDNSFDLVISLDYLEHQEKDELCLQEIHRVLRQEGKFIFVTPRTKSFLVIYKLRQALGLKLEHFGHKREGYTHEELQEKLVRANFALEKITTFSRFFSEFFELILNFLYIKFLSPQQMAQLRDGHIRPSTAEEFLSQKKKFQMYSFLYPLIWLFSRLDCLLFFQKGYNWMVWAKKASLKK